VLLAGVPACASAPQAPEASIVRVGADFAPDVAVDDPEADDLFGSEFEIAQETESSDPFEGTNRALLSFNQGLSRRVFDPMIIGYRFVTPDPARRAVQRIFANFKAPSTLINDLLQLRFKDAAQTIARFVLNTTIGFGGIFDVAIEAGWVHHESDFGQTLGRFGVTAGPYLVLPVFGPNTIRDGFGDVIDLFFQPLTYLIGPTPNLMIGAGSGFTTLDAHDAALKALEESSVDYYAALRSAYLQSRAAHIRGYEK
jgi:phospholipid-binding lipoprotein MlaA